MALRLELQRRLARSGDDSMAAMAHRLRASRFVAGVSQVQIARSGWASPDLAHIEAAEAGLVMPGYALEGFYWRCLKLTSDFFESGEVKDIPIAIEDRLLAALKAQIDRT
jgi:hypothetical protein